MSIRPTHLTTDPLCTRCQQNPGRQTILGASSGQLAGSRVLWCRPCIIRSKIAHAEAVSATLPSLKHQLGGDREVADAEALVATLPALRQRLAAAEHEATRTTLRASSSRDESPWAPRRVGGVL